MKVRERGGELILIIFITHTTKVDEIDGVGLISRTKCLMMMQHDSLSAVSAIWK